MHNGHWCGRFFALQQIKKTPLAAPNRVESFLKRKEETCNIKGYTSDSVRLALHNKAVFRSGVR